MDRMQLISGLMIEWEKIEKGSYLREINPCQYEETDSYQVTAMFIQNRQQLLHRLLDD